MTGRPPEQELRGYTDAEFSDLERQVSEWIAEHGAMRVADDLRAAINARRRVRFRMLNAMCVVALVDRLVAERDEARQALDALAGEPAMVERLRAAEARVAALQEAFREITDMPLTDFHIGQAQRMARAALAASPEDSRG